MRTFGENGEPIGVEVRLFIAAYAPKPDMYVFGAIDFSRAMARIGKYLGYRVTVVDARPVFATTQRVPDADEVVVAWPDEFLAGAPVDERTALIVLTHDVKFDHPRCCASRCAPRPATSARWAAGVRTPTASRSCAGSG